MNQLDQQLQGTNIYLIGMMGCGKTTVGQALAKALNFMHYLLVIAMN